MRERNGNIPIPAPVAKVLAVLHEAGYEAYIVGGCVRDHLMGRVPGDYDVTTSALPEETMEAFRGWRIIETGLKHGTVTVVSEGENVEITTFRIDGAYTDNRHPESVTFTRSLKEDMARRDFTVNAMAYADSTGVIDHYGGMTDLDSGTIRCVGDAEKRFREDGLRILRAMRFSSVLDFFPAEDDGDGARMSTKEAVRALQSLLQGISRERIYVEMTKLLRGVAAGRVLRTFPDVVCTILPELREAWVLRAADAMDRMPRGTDAAVRYAVLLWETDEDGMQKSLRSLKMSRAEEKRIRCLWEARTQTDPDRYTRRKMCGMWENQQTGWNFCRDHADMLYAAGTMEKAAREKALARIDGMEKEKLCCSVKELAVGGADMQKMGCQGKEIGETMAYLLEEVLRERVPNEREALLAAAERRRNHAEE